MQNAKQTRWVENKAYQYRVDYIPPVYVKAPNIWIDEHARLTVWYRGEEVYSIDGLRNMEDAHYELNQYFEVMC